MDTYRYHVGDRVQLLVDHPENQSALRAGDTGIVVYVSGSTRCIGVCWEVERDKDNLHACNDYCEDGYGWFVDSCMIAPEEEILIELDDLI